MDKRDVETRLLKSLSRGRSNTVIVEIKKPRKFRRPEEAPIVADIVQVPQISPDALPASRPEASRKDLKSRFRASPASSVTVFDEVAGESAANIVPQPRKTDIQVSEAVLSKLSEAMPAMRELARFAGAPRYEAYFKGGVAAQITKAGALSSVQHDGKRITEVAKLRSLRPGQIANLGFSFVTAVVGMEHMARIERRLGRIENKVDALTAMLADDIAAPVRDIAYSIHRFNGDDGSSVSNQTAENWINDLRRVRQRLFPQIEKLARAIQPSSSFLWSSQLADLKSGADQLREAGQLLELVAGSEAMLYRMAWSTRIPHALDGVHGATALTLAYEIRKAAIQLLKSTDKDCVNNVDRRRDRKNVFEDALAKFDKLITRLADCHVIADVMGRLMDESREFCVTVSNGKVLGLHEVDRLSR